MKKVLLLGLALLFVSSAVSAQQLALYNDEARTTFSVMDVEMMDLVRVYLFCSPPADGLTCIELGMLVEGPGAFNAFQPVYNSDVAQPVLAAGFPTGDTGGCFNSCHSEDWLYFCYADLFMMSNLPVYISIVPFQGPPVQAWPKMLTCTGGGDLGDDPYETEAFVLNNFCINDICEVSVEESTWGAIKNLYE